VAPEVEHPADAISSSPAEIQLQIRKFKSRLLIYFRVLKTRTLAHWLKRAQSNLKCQFTSNGGAAILVGIISRRVIAASRIYRLMKSMSLPSATCESSGYSESSATSP